MPDTFTLYLPRPLGPADLGPAWRDGNPIAVARLGSARATLDAMDAAALPAHLDGVSGRVGELVVADAGFPARVANVTSVVGCVIEPALDPVARAWLTALARRVGGFVFDGSTFREPDGTVLAAPGAAPAPEPAAEPPSLLSTPISDGDEENTDDAETDPGPRRG